ncbi:DUF4294 domain-containing protein [Sediminibacterium sp. C3]|uniref:DUF4294 domain-containing protein n=1 Tax=Sediminibacterium sp. C3 TaxID=1267211 RepID=UPI00040E518C|nr:DUF4294 domain-containing protein [Sediminibacterium sp. C3]
MGTKYFPVILLFCSICCTGLLKAQDKGIYDTVRVYAYITPQGDTIGESWLPSVEVIGKLNAAGRKYWAEWTRLRNAVYVTYPYAKAASRIINEINLQLVNVSDKQMRRKIIRSREKEMKKQFTDQLTKLSVYQGRVLMKLINRETGNNCYEIIEEYKGFMTAAFWQTVAFVFGSNLKQPYDPGTKDAEMEKIVKDVARMYGYPG